MEALTNNITAPTNKPKTKEIIQKRSQRAKKPDPSVFKFSASFGPLQYENYGDHSTLGIKVIDIVNVELFPANKEKVTTRFPQEIADNANIALPGYVDASTNSVAAPLEINNDLVYTAKGISSAKIFSVLGGTFSVFQYAKVFKSEDEDEQSYIKPFNYNHGYGGTSGYVYKFHQEITYEDKGYYYKIPMFDVKVGLLDFHNRRGHVSAFADMSYEKLHFNRKTSINAREKLTYNGIEPTENRSFSASFNSTYTASAYIYRMGLALTAKVIPHDVYDYNALKILIGVQYKDKEISGVKNCSVDMEKHPLSVFLGVTVSELNLNFLTWKK